MMLPLVSMFMLSTGFAATPKLLPAPQHIEWHEDACLLSQEVRVSIPDDWKDPVKSYLWLLEETLAPKGYFHVECVSPTVDAVLRIEAKELGTNHENEYSLEINKHGVMLWASQPSGVFNGLATLVQLIEQSEGNPIKVTACSIRDWPELPLRAVHIDLTVQQFTPQYVQALMRTLARYKINAILMEYSAMFPYRKHRAISLPDAFTKADIRAIRRTASACNQELIPFLQCLGHMDYLLHLPEYERYGKDHDRYMLCPSSEESMPLVRELIDEILLQHPGLRYLHVGGDEVSPRKCKKCLAYTKDHSFSELYVKHYTDVAGYCRQRGVKPMMWSDMGLQHPEALTKLPSDVAWVVWDYVTTSDLCQSLPHGARMGHFDKLKPEYVKYFGEGIGLPQAEQRGGLVAFGHAVGFKNLGYSAFSAPAARCAGDNFALPRFKMHMENIRMAFLKALDFKLPGSIITSWSYRGSPHEICLPEYVCASYGWNTATADVERLLAQFFRQRYGIDGTSLARSVLAESTLVPPSTRAIPKYVDEKQAWLYAVSTQLEQIKQLARNEPDKQLESMQSWLDRLGASTSLWDEAQASAKRHRDELRQWNLSRRHLMHRLRLIQPLVHLILANESDSKPDEGSINRWKQELESLAEPRRALRKQWAELYRNIATTRFLEIELEQRFDAEQDMIEAVLSGQ